MGDWSNERMRELGAGSGTMSDRRAWELDTQTDALVRVAAALAHGTVSDLKARFGAARDARVPDVWVEELLLQSLLVVGYPRALDAAEQLHSHLRGALNTGASPEEVEAVLVTVDADLDAERRRVAWEQWEDVRRRKL